MRDPIEVATLEHGIWRVQFESYYDECPDLTYMGEFTQEFDPPCIDRLEGVFVGPYRHWLYDIPGHLVIDEGYHELEFEPARETRHLRALLERQELGRNPVYVEHEIGDDGIYHIDVNGYEVLKYVGSTHEHNQMRYYKPDIHIKDMFAFQDPKRRRERNAYIHDALQDWKRLEGYYDGDYCMLDVHAELYRGDCEMDGEYFCVDSDDHDGMRERADDVLQTIYERLTTFSLHHATVKAGQRAIVEMRKELVKWGLDWKEWRWSDGR